MHLSQTQKEQIRPHGRVNKDEEREPFHKFTPQASILWDGQRRNPIFSRILRHGDIPGGAKLASGLWDWGPVNGQPMLLSCLSSFSPLTPTLTLCVCVCVCVWVCVCVCGGQCTLEPSFSHCSVLCCRIEQHIVPSKFCCTSIELSQGIYNIFFSKTKLHYFFMKKQKSCIFGCFLPIMITQQVVRLWAVFDKK